MSRVSIGGLGVSLKVDEPEGVVEVECGEVLGEGEGGFPPCKGHVRGME